MQNMKKKACDSNINNNGGGGDLKQQERHIVSWSQEEDDILREQIGIHGTSNWALIASRFKDKTTRQCRRRWFTYLNSDFKKGGWSKEEDMLLCEAQKIFGNKWTEIAKVVSGRTDNAVKNRFSTLCKKRAKHEASPKENNAVCVNTNNKRAMFNIRRNTDGIFETPLHPMKMRRKHIPATTKGCNLEEGLGRDSRTTGKQLRPPLAVLMENCQNFDTSTTEVHANNEEASKDASSCNMIEETFLKKDDPKIIALMQQNHGSEYGMGSTIPSKINEKMELPQDNLCKIELQLAEAIEPISLLDDILPSCDKLNIDDGCVCPLPNSEFNSPVQVTPSSRSMAEEILSPRFSESERHFLLKTLGMEGAWPNRTTKTPPPPPPCKRALLHCL